VHHDIANKLLRAGDLAGAEAAFNATLEEAPDDAVAVGGLARVRERRGQLAAAGR
jgi:Flp pilus assembly protein TadD